MRVAVIGSRTVTVSNLGDYLPLGTDEIVSGGAAGVDRCARAYALEQNLKLTEFLPDYSTYGRAAPLQRNLQIIAYSDLVLAFWDGQSPGTRFVIQHCQKSGTPVQIFRRGTVFRSSYQNSTR